MKKSTLCFFLLLLVVCTAGCAKRMQEAPGYHIYVTDQQHTKLRTKDFTTQSVLATDILAEMLDQMKRSDASGENYSIFPEGIEITGYTLTDGQLTVTFNRAYSQLKNTEEVLLRAGLVMTATQLEGVRTVVFHIEDDALLDSAGEPVGAMTGDQFICNQVGVNSYQFAALTLYFSNAAGNKVVREVRNVHYSSNTTLERVTMEQLLAGPSGQQLLPILPENVKLLDIKVEGDTCTLNMSKEFLNVRDDGTLLPEVTIYGIVNSLCDMLNVDKVQFQVEGQSNVIYKEKLSLGGPFHRNSDLIEVQDNTESGAPASGVQPAVGL